MQAFVLVLSGLLIVRTSSPLIAAQIPTDFRVLRSIPVAANPHGIAFSPDGMLVFVVSSAGQTLTVLDSITDTIERTFPLTDTPLGIVLMPDGRHAAISHFGADRISRIDLRTGEIDRTLRVGGRPSLFAPTRDGRRAFISCEAANRVFEIDLEAFTVVREFETGKATFPSSGQQRFAVALRARL
jgi:DNA-binding beta-propeller fold protein YncE